MSELWEDDAWMGPAAVLTGLALACIFDLLERKAINRMKHQVMNAKEENAVNE